jgi:hypothetical protein
MHATRLPILTAFIFVFYVRSTFMGFLELQPI